MRLRMTSILVGLSAVFGSSPSWGQDGAPAPVFGPPIERPKESPKKPDVVQRDDVPADVAALRKRLVAWPTPAAREDVERIATEGDELTPLLMKCLDDRDWRVRAGAAAALGRRRETEAFPRLAQAIDDVENRIALPTLFEAMVRIDEQAATSEILAFLEASSSRVARQAFDALPTELDEVFRPRLVALLRHRRDRVRERSVALLTRLPTPPRTETLVELLGDRSSRVASEAASLLARRDDPAITRRLVDVVVDSTARRSSYAVISLARREERTNRPVLPDDERVRTRLTGFLRRRSPLERATGAVGLAGLARRSDDAALRTLADRHLMFFLIDAVFGGNIFADYGAVKDLCLARARRLSGVDFGEDGRAWREWWVANEKTFEARRELQRVDQLDLSRTVVSYARRRGDDGFRFAATTDATSRQATTPRAFVVSTADMATIRDALAQADVFSDRGGTFDAGWSGDFVQMTVDVGPRTFRRFHRGDLPAEILGLESTFRALRRKLLPQLYYIRGDGDFEAWLVRTNARVAAEAAAATEERLRVEGLARFEDLDPAGRQATLELWGDLPDVAAASTRLDRFVALLTSPRVDQRSREMIVTLLERIPDARATDQVMTRLELASARDVEVARAFLSSRSTDQLARLTEHRRAPVRRLAVVELAGRLDEPNVIETLLKMMVDPSPTVVEALAAALVRAPDRERLLPELERLAGTDDARRHRAIDLYGRIGQDGAVAALERWFASGGEAVKVAVIRGFASAGTDRAVASLARIATEADDAGYRLEALSALVGLNSDRARNHVRELLVRETQPERLISVVSAAAEVLGDTLATDLDPLLKSPEASVRRHVAFTLADRGVSAAVPALTELLLDRTWAGAARDRLERLACYRVESIEPEEVRDGYVAWWERSRTKQRDEWFLDALRSHGFDAADLLGYLRGRKNDLRSLDLLVKVLTCDVWFLRANAERILVGIRGTGTATLDRFSTPQEIVDVVADWREYVEKIRSGR